MKFEEIVKRITGISTPIFGISWSPNESEISVAKRIINKLEDRRVLYNPSELEMPDHCAKSIIEIRAILTDELIKVENESDLSNSIRAMRNACRKFLNTIQYDDYRLTYARNSSLYSNWVFDLALGELRGVFGIHIMQIAVKYGLKVEDDLSTILPISENEND